MFTYDAPLFVGWVTKVTFRLGVLPDARDPRGVRS
jgi:hypothetical protein